MRRRADQSTNEEDATEELKIENWRFSFAADERETSSQPLFMRPDLYAIDSRQRVLRQRRWKRTQRRRGQDLFMEISRILAKTILELGSRLVFSEVGYDYVSLDLIGRFGVSSPNLGTEMGLAWNLAGVYMLDRSVGGKGGSLSYSPLSLHRL
ncbi:hypothetical protein CC79DRAFT_865272 [Sarocladium strictum]